MCTHTSTCMCVRDGEVQEKSMSLPTTNAVNIRGAECERQSSVLQRGSPDS